MEEFSVSYSEYGIADPFYRTPVNHSYPVLWTLDDPSLGGAGAAQAKEDFANADDVGELTFSKQHEAIMANEVLQQNRRLPPLLNEHSLFTKASPYGDATDRFYHSPSSRIGSNYTPAAAAATGVLFEELPASPTSPRRPPKNVKRKIEDISDRIQASTRIKKPVTAVHAHRAAAVIEDARRGLGQQGEADTLVVHDSPRVPMDVSAAEACIATGSCLSPFLPEKLSPAEKRCLSDAILRFFFYIDYGVSDAHIAPFQEEWAANALELVPDHLPPNLSEEFFHGLISGSLEEMKDDYIRAMKKSVVEYILKSKVERVRLQLESLEPLLRIPDAGMQSRIEVVFRQIPPSWNIHVDNAREEIAWTLQTLSANHVELNNMWISQSFDSRLLLDVSSNDFKTGLPMTASRFESFQFDVTDMAKGQLWTSWVPKTAEVFRRIPPVCINGDADAYYRSVTTLQSNQLRTLVKDSLDGFLQYFQRHHPVPQVDPNQEELLWSHPALFQVALIIDESGKLAFQPPFAEFEAIVQTAIEGAVKATHDIPKVGSHLAVVGAQGISSSVTRGTKRSSIPSVGLEELSIVSVRRQISEIMEGNQAAPKLLAELFEEHMHLATMDIDAHVDRFGNGETEPSLAEYREEIDKFLAAASAIRSRCTDDVRTGLYYVHCANFKEQLAQYAEEVVSKLLEQMRTRVMRSNEAITDSYKVQMQEVGKAVHSGEEVLTLKKYIAKCMEDQEVLREQIGANKGKQEFLVEFQHPLKSEDYDTAMVAYEWPKKMVNIMREATTKANHEHHKFEKALKQRRAEFGELLEQLQAQLNGLQEFGELSQRERLSKEVAELNDKLKEVAETAEEINAQEKMFGWAASKYGHIAQMAQTLEPYYNLWTTTSWFLNKFSEWMTGPFSKLDPERVSEEVGEAYRKVFKLVKVFGGIAGAEPREAPKKLAEEIRDKIHGFQGFLPLINAICNPGLRQRHWALISDAVGFEIKPDEVTSLRRLLENDINEHVQRITEVSDTASREWSIEKALQKMQEDWEGLAFELAPWKETGTFILKGGPVEEAQALLDDHIVKSQAMVASPFAMPFEESIVPWEKKLVRLQDILDQWLKCQSKWIYLEPIFGSEEIMKQIPKEGGAFKEMDGIWRTIMENVQEDPLVLTVAEMPQLLEQLQEGNAQLDVVEKGLNAFLDTKKMAFPRFYFLSNDELLEILSEAKDPKNIQPFMKKCFEAVKEVIFEDNGEISGMISVEGENIPWIEAVNPAATGAVERWLMEVQGVMFRTMHDLAGKALEAYAQVERAQWILEWPGQLVLNCSQVYWTREVTTAIAEGGSKGLEEYGEKCNKQLNSIVNLVRGKLTSLERASCGALVVIDVHARDVVVQMAKDKVEDVRDFKWEAQLRYYWEFNEAPPSGVHPQETIMVRMINAEALYGYEYLGNSSRLVITPLTDRCYRTLMGAIHMNLGGAPAGPAGTGKTETTKDLSKALAIQCVVFNCSDGLDYKAMGKFFKGLACSGAWACFDEFNRIELEVLSVVAQQVLSIIRAKAAKLKVFVFEGSEIPLVMTCNAFITMNPGYAGRSELPDNLKALFRDVAMMVPDYAMIAEIILYSFGYLEARSLAQKLVQTYRLCSEQLSSQDHYDYGMRAVISVLRAAGNLKRKYVDEEEDVLMLRAITDVNLPKFLDQDVPLFKGILSDLFPGVTLPEIDYTNMIAALEEHSVKRGLQPLQSFFTKIIQLYEMIVVRHGLMLVGQSFGMKTEAYRVLRDALSDMYKKGQGEFNTKVYVLNPKSITMGQLYGQEDLVSKEWTDGVLAVLFRDAARDTSPDRKWVLFDGPVDAIWIENMNTVLDDNKKLCLNSGEIIAMQGLMNMIFEVQDLAVASPATVSRCGMVYMQPSLLGWKAVMQSWMARLPEELTQEHRTQIQDLFEWLMPPMLRVATKQVKAPVAMQDINLAQSCMRLLEAHLPTFMDQLARDPEAMTPSVQIVWLQSMFLFSIVWSVGCNTDEAGRKHIDAQLRKLIANDVPADLEFFMERQPPGKVTQPFPDTMSVFDFVFDTEKGRWVHWMDTIESKGLDPEAEFTSIIVPTVDTIRYTYLLDKYVCKGFPVMFVGPTGTGKSVYIKKHLQGSLPERYTSFFVSFSAQTSANMTQDVIDGKLDKRRRGTFGPPAGKQMVIFVDDLNMPQVEVYGAQPPIELLRQWMDHGGWYDRKELSQRNIIDVQWVAAMAPPGGGRNSVTNRYLRHYSVLSITPFDNNNMAIIFNALADWWLKKFNYSSSLQQIAKKLVAATLEVYETVQRELLPTPTKSHYTFNLRDVSKVFQGIVKIGGGVADGGQMVRLWVHEVLRVFYDRLISNQDRVWLGMLLAEMTDKHFKEKLNKAWPCDLQYHEALKIDKVSEETVVTGLRSLVFCDFMIPGADPAKYDEVESQEQLLAICNDYMSDFNATSKKPMNLVLFQFALEHIARICRIITSPAGHALLVGMGGSGRQSLTKLAAFIEEFDVFQIEISRTYSKVEWHEDIKRVLKLAGEANKKVVFLFSDTQIKEEGFVEDISNLLNTYEVPNLMQSGDLATIFENIRPRAKQAGMDGSRDAMYNFFIQEVRKNLHIVLSFSPVGDSFRERLRKFPSLVNCTTIDWFTRWPQDALSAVATNFLSGLPGVEEKIVAELPELCVLFHNSVHELSSRFLAEQRRPYYVTPTSYLELLLSYKDLLGQRQKEVSTVKKRYEVGLEKLATTESSVSLMKEELIALQPQLEESTRETEQAMEVIAAETVEADKVKEVVSKEEAVASEEASKVKAIKDECEADLAEAMPVLDSAIKALNTLSKGDIAEVKGMKSPPGGVKLVLEAVCILKNVKPTRMKDPNSGKMVDDYFESAKKMLMEGDFLDSLRAYDKDNIPEKIINQIRPYVNNPEFDPAKILQASKAAHGLCCWVRAMEVYDKVAKEVAPKKVKLAQAEADLDVVMTALRAKQAELQEVLDKLAALSADLQEKKNKKDTLEHEVHMCEVKLDRAEKLIAGLGGEKTRWTQAAVSLGKEYVRLTGDALLSAAQIAYLGPFTALYRSDALAKWLADCVEKGIPCSDRFSLEAILGNPVKIRDWNIQGLPKDSFSTDNGICMDIARRWPLCIDPQGAANKYIRNMEKSRSLQVIKLTDPNYLRTLENSIQFGKPVLLENILETLDATLEPLLLKQTFKQGGAMCIKLGDSVVEYADGFKFYLTTKLRNPHYPPEICTKVSLLNFMTTPEGLEDQLLGIVVAKERPDLEEEKNKLIIQGAENKRKLKEIEDEILRVLSSSEGNILEDEQAVTILQSSKTLSDDISEKQKVADETEAKIDEARAGYKPVAHHSSILYFCIQDLANIEPMYQYSLAWFVGLFLRAIADSERSEELEIRLQLLNDYFTFFLYQNAQRSLFEKDKLLFAFVLASKLQIDKGRISAAELRFLLTGGVSLGDSPAENPDSSWISNKMWGELCRASALRGAAWAGLYEHVAANTQAWRKIYDSLTPENDTVPEPYGSQLESFQKLVLLRCLRPDKLIPAITFWVASTIGKRFVEPQPFAIEPSYNESSATVPLIFVLSKGSDPMASLLQFADDREVKVDSVSLGQGQGPRAEALISSGAKEGFWVVLQNCHLAKSFLPRLEMICEQQLVEGKVHRNFRLWLTSYPSEIFPIAILENSIKMTNEAPKGLRAGLQRTYMMEPICSAEFFEGCSKDAQFRKMLFGLAFFHSIILERCKFGPIGWNIPYEFNENDLRISVRQLKMFLDEYAEIPYDTLSYTCGECNYGGKVTDGHDRHTLMTILATFYNPDVLEDNHSLSPSGTYCVPDYTDHKGYLDCISQLPLLAMPEVFGLHDNADITKDLKATHELLDSLMLTQSRDASSGGKSVEETMGDVASGILERLPANFDLEMVERKYSQDYYESMNTVLVQELGRFNNLLDIMRNSLVNLGKAVLGLALMSTELDQVGQALFDGKVPALWLKKSFPSLKPLGSYVAEVLDRISFFQGWIDNGMPGVFWLSGFFFTQAFLTGSKQNFARKYKVPIDLIDFDFAVRDGADDCKEPPSDGVYVDGLFLEGCRWDYSTHALGESESKVLYTSMPKMYFMPSKVSDFKDFPHYNCPMYKTLDRRGVLSTTGHSTNFVLDVRVPSDQPSSHWTKRGVALFTALSD